MTHVIRTLICDDVEDIRVLLRMSLELDGSFEIVAEASNGREAVEAAERLEPDVILLDLSMPEMDGLEALPILGRVSPRSRVVVLSGFEASKMAARAAALGAVHYLEKGASPRRVCAAVRAAAGVQAAPAVNGSPRREAPRAHVPDDRMIGDVLAVIRHEVATPVVAAHGLATLLVRSADRLDEAKRADLGHRLLRNLDRLTHLLERFDRMRSIADGTLEADAKQPVRVRSLLERAARELHDRHPERPVEIRCPTEGTVFVDEELVQHALRNVVTNAQRFAPEGTTIALEGTFDGGEGILTVQDRGQGVPDEDKERIFDRFVQLDGRGSGIGLGLYIAREAVAANGGRIRIADTDGGGAKVRIELPSGRRHPTRA